MLRTLERAVETFSPFSEPRVAISRVVDVMGWHKEQNSKSLHRSEHCPPILYTHTPPTFAVCWTHCTARLKGRTQLKDWAGISQPEGFELCKHKFWGTISWPTETAPWQQPSTPNFTDYPLLGKFWYEDTGFEQYPLFFAPVQDLNTGTCVVKVKTTYLRNTGSKHYHLVYGTEAVPTCFALQNSCRDWYVH